MLILWEKFLSLGIPQKLEAGASVLTERSSSVRKVLLRTLTFKRLGRTREAVTGLKR